MLSALRVFLDCVDQGAPEQHVVQLSKLATVLFRDLVEDSLALLGERQQRPPAVVRVFLPDEQSPSDASIDQERGGMVSNLQSFRHLSDCHSRVRAMPTYHQEHEMLLWGDAVDPRSLLGEPKKFAERAAEVRLVEIVAIRELTVTRWAGVLLYPSHTDVLRFHSAPMA